MELTEKEIEDTIFDHLPVSVKRQLKKTGSMYYIQLAARVIFRRLQEGVVWEGEGKIAHGQLGGTWIILSSGRITISHDEELGENHERVQVTVKTIKK